MKKSKIILFAIFFLNGICLGDEDGGAESLEELMGLIKRVDRVFIVDRDGKEVSTNNIVSASAGPATIVWTYSKDQAVSIFRKGSDGKLVRHILTFGLQAQYMRDEVYFPTFEKDKVIWRYKSESSDPVAIWEFSGDRIEDIGIGEYKRADRVFYEIGKKEGD